MSQNETWTEREGTIGSFQIMTSGGGAGGGKGECVRDRERIEFQNGLYCISQT